MSKERKLRRATAKKQKYLKQYASRIAKGDRNTPTYTQWSKASETERGLMAAGIGQKKLRRMKK